MGVDESVAVQYKYLRPKGESASVHLGHQGGGVET